MNDGQAVVETRDLTRRFGRVMAVNNVNLNIPAGVICGFIGPNGAGKTTTIRILSTLLEPSSGEARVCGFDVRADPTSVRRNIGYMPDFFGVYDDMKVWEYLDFFAACYKIPAARRRKLIADLLELVDLEEKHDAYVDHLSRGMKQRLCLARTLVHDPPLLILDEPASGLDPRARIEMRELLKELRSLGKTILVSSHILSELGELCDMVAIIEAGTLLASGSVEAILRRVQQQRVVALTVLSDLGRAQAILKETPNVELWDEVDGEEGCDAEKEIEFGFAGENGELSALLARLVQEGIPVLSFAERHRELEDAFMQVTEGRLA